VHHAYAGVGNLAVEAGACFLLRAPDFRARISRSLTWSWRTDMSASSPPFRSRTRTIPAAGDRQSGPAAAVFRPGSRPAA